MEDRAHLDGFKDVLSIEKDKITLLYTKYELIIEGEELQINAFTKSELILFGKINAVLFVYRNV